MSKMKQPFKKTGNSMDHSMGVMCT